MLMFLFTIPITQTVSENKGFTQIQNIGSFTNTNASSTPITITGNVQLADQASTGNGSSENPYILENIVISHCSSNSPGISIQNTNKYFVLQNIIVTYCSTGFYFENVTFGSITHSFATNDVIGTWFTKVFFSNITDAFNSYNAIYGFYLLTSSNNLLSNNIAINSDYPVDEQGDGFSLSSSSNNMLVNNIAMNNNYGFYLYFSSNIILNNNISQYNGKSNYIENHSSNNTLSNNKFTNASSLIPFGLSNVFFILGLLAIIIIIMLGLIATWYVKTKHVNRFPNPTKDTGNTNSDNLHVSEPHHITKGGFTNIQPDKAINPPLPLIESILVESFNAPDYETAVKIQQGGFPDYATFKQALDKGITTYSEWLKYQKEH